MIQPGMMPEADFSGGPYILAAAYTGKFPSAYTEGAASTDTRLVVVGDGDFINESLVGAIPDNVELGLNIVDWLVQDDALLSIRSKKVEPRNLGETPEALRPWIKYTNMLGPTLLVVLFGLVRWRQRKSRHVIITGKADS